MLDGRSHVLACTNCFFEQLVLQEHWRDLDFTSDSTITNAPFSMAMLNNQRRNVFLTGFFGPSPCAFRRVYGP